MEGGASKDLFRLFGMRTGSFGFALVTSEMLGDGVVPGINFDRSCYFSPTGGGAGFGSGGFGIVSI